MNIVRPPFLVRKVYKDLVWRIKTQEKHIYLSFDDGPIPFVTPWVLDTLSQYKAKATFFCVGENVKCNPGIYNRILAENHAVGNHTHNHLNGWKTKTADYLLNVEECARWTGSSLFRPPYGKLKSAQYKALKQTYSLIMWDVLSFDYDPDTSPAACLNNVLSKTREGSIVVFHDSLKAKENLFYCLPKFLEYFTNKGFCFKALSLTAAHSI